MDENLGNFTATWKTTLKTKARPDNSGCIGTFIFLKTITPRLVWDRFPDLEVGILAVVLLLQLAW